MFSNTKGLAIPEGNIIKIECNNVILWQLQQKEQTFEDIYQQVEYIEAAANVGAYLNLGFAFDTKAKIELSQYISIGTTTYIFGCAENSGKLRCMLTSPSSTKALAYSYGSTGSAYIENHGITLSNNAWNELEVIWESGNISMTNKTNGDSDSKTTQGIYTMTNDLYLFAQNYNGTARFGGLRRIGYFKYYNKNNELICDLVPCYRKSDGVIGMYDHVRKTFFTNVGSGTFTKGADIIN